MTELTPLRAALSRLWLGLILAVLLVAGACAPSPTTPGGAAQDPVTTTSTTAPAATVTPEATTVMAASEGADGVLALLEELMVSEEPQRFGYDRDLFPHWSDLDGDGCRTRAEVLRSESTTPAQVDPYGCQVVAGDWFSAYDGEMFDDPSEVEIDHVVALAEAWDSGASTWTTERREAFANDTDLPGALIAVSSASNQSKSDKDPADWQPSRREAWCSYASDWVAVKHKWHLEVDPAEKRALTNMVVSSCTAAAQVSAPPVEPAPESTVAAPSASAPSTTAVVATGGDCDTSYQSADGSCVPRRDLVGDLDCGNLRDEQKPVTVGASDPHHFDADHNGVGCENT